MGSTPRARRDFLKASLAAAGALAWRGPVYAQRPAVRFAVIGINHGHINGQIAAVMAGGGELVSFFAREADLAAGFAKRYPEAKQARSEREILEDASIQLVLSAAIPNARAPLGAEVMRHGKDFMVDKPGCTTLDLLAELRRVQARTKRIYAVLVERHEHRATTRAGELVKAGAIGDVIQTIGLGPHRMNPQTRPPWFFKREQYGGILCDLASHHVDQFLFFTASTRADIPGDGGRAEGAGRGPARRPRPGVTSGARPVTCTGCGTGR